MEKILKKYTTIPEHLYVNRSADEQLARIVNEMERPGYVLVARQMGKTNLLFNAKRKLENEHRMFVYVDLSNYFEVERDCYRNIIDCIIEPNELIFKSIENQIQEIRHQELPPHNEYSKSLRVVLKKFEGNLVIILDEVDALRSSDYSDHIFAQIRSNYFARTNFPEFKRLTYILSGVSEPSELIKDKNKSPFNIGDKIYLDDFTFEEHNAFIKKSKLAISDDISNAIYGWTNGNPRLTFDICSEVENYIIDELALNENIISQIIKNKYLTSFDIAPVDHIRELVKTNKMVRKAVYNMQKGIGNISDDIKSKLYLYGIIGSKFNEKLIIKNRIIEESLSIEWINTIEKQIQDGLSYGLDKFDNGEYKEAISILIEFDKNSNPTKQQSEICNYNIGFAYYNLRDWKNAISYFSKEYTETELYKYNSLSLLGSCKIANGEQEEGINILEKIILEKTTDFAYHNALLNLAPNIENFGRKLSLYQKLYESTLTAKEENDSLKLNKLRTIALYYQAEIHFNNSNIPDALLKIKEAKKYSNISDSLYLIYFEHELTKGKEEKYELLKSLIDTIINNKIEFDTKNIYTFSFNEIHLQYYIELSFEKTNLELFDKIVNYAVNTIYGNKKGKYEIVYSVSKLNYLKQNDILNYIIEEGNEVEKDLKLKVYKDLALNNADSKEIFSTNFKKYLDIFKTENFQIFNNDIYLFAIAIKYFSDRHKIEEAIDLCEIIEDRLIKLNDIQLNFESLIIYYWHSSLYFSLKDKEKAIYYADKTLSFINNSKRQRTSIIDEKGLQSIAEQMNQIKKSSITRIPVISSKQYGRNDKIKVKYLDGSTKEGKYKGFEADILAERCVIVQ